MSRKMLPLRRTYSKYVPIQEIADIPRSSEIQEPGTSICCESLMKDIISIIIPLKDIIYQISKPFVLLGDFNSRNTSWGCTHTDSREHTVEEFLDEELLSFETTMSQLDTSFPMVPLLQ